MRMATSRSPPESDHSRRWSTLSIIDAPTAESVSTAATPRRTQRVRTLRHMAPATPARMAATRRAGRTTAHGIADRLGTNSRAIASTSSARIRHRRAIRMISSMRILERIHRLSP